MLPLSPDVCFPVGIHSQDVLLYNNARCRAGGSAEGRRREKGGLPGAYISMGGSGRSCVLHLLLGWHNLCRYADL